MGALYLSAEGYVGPADRPRYHELLNGKLGQVPREVWTECLKTEDAAVKLVMGFLDRGIVVQLGSQFEDALLAHAQAVIGSKVEPVKWRGQWSRLAGALPSALREDLLRNIRDSILEAPEPVGKVLALWGGTLLEEGFLRRRRMRLCGGSGEW